MASSALSALVCMFIITHQVSASSEFPSNEHQEPDVTVIKILADVPTTTKRVFSMDLSTLNDDSIEINRVDVINVEPFMDNVDFFATFHGFRMDIHATIVTSVDFIQTYQMTVQISDIPVPTVNGAKQWHYQPKYDTDGKLIGGSMLPPLRDFREYRRQKVTLEFTLDVQQ